MIEIVPESKDHASAIFHLTVEAFTDSAFGHNGEAELIDSLRQKAVGCLSLVAVQGQEVVGHLLFSPATIEAHDGTVAGMALAPMSVSPVKQRQGIGSRLILDGLAMFQATDCKFVVVAGHPDFYPQFGFKSASDVGLTHGFAGMPQQVFFVKCFDGFEEKRLRTGKAFYHPIFGSQHE